ncbi:hypothetical protein I3843_02G003300 [Carya illinoinensis]|uniref:Uncharacterized protein n=1 Tax=Carya illinoinensis TaxID=32201 RepID=A0A922JXR4_CARIL|nr:hypothetical protein I3842_02G007800 [Carya illinoinensis]KAG7989985.1 hypothetical protein I3843_02G003300 [Carya illinoinensis]
MWVFVLLLFWRKVGVSTLPPWEERVWLFSSSLGGWSGVYLSSSEGRLFQLWF